MQIKHIPVRTSNILPKGLLQYVDRGTLELCLHLIVLSLSLVRNCSCFLHRIVPLFGLITGWVLKLVYIGWVRICLYFQWIGLSVIEN
jgi:hypothetical protein